VSEPAILVRRLTGSQVWSMEKLENKLIDMREMYQEYKDHPLSMVSLLLLVFQAANLTHGH
jgi:Kinesin protein 1B